MATGFFITGTDTDVGKTVAALSLMRSLQDKGYTVSGFKPVSAGCRNTADGLRNDDAVQLQKASSVSLPYSVINPYAFEPPIAPHIAAAQAGVSIEILHIQSCYTQIAAQNDVVIVEGAGGWLVPINDSETMVDIAQKLKLPVILVTGIRLGCLNHTLLTVQSILTAESRLGSGITLAAWVANHLGPESSTSTSNVHYLQQHIHAPLIAQIPFDPDLTAGERAKYFDISLL